MMQRRIAHLAEPRSHSARLVQVEELALGE